MKFNFCPKCGGELVKKPLYLLCKKCGFELFDNPKVCVNLFLENKKGEILLAQRRYPPKKGTWDLPGGFVDSRESAEEAVRREAKEELNLAIKKENLEYLFSYPDTYNYQGPRPVLSLFYKIKLPGKLLKNLKCKDDVSDIKFIRPAQIGFKEIGFKSTRQAIRKHYLA